MAAEAGGMTGRGIAAVGQMLVGKTNFVTTRAQVKDGPGRDQGLFNGRSKNGSVGSGTLRRGGTRDRTRDRARDRPEHHGQVVRIGVVEQRARPLVEHVGIDAVRLEERDAALPTLALGLGKFELMRQIGDLMVETLPRLEAVVARISIEPEIADEQRRQDVEAERNQKRTNPRPNDHAAFLPSGRLRGD